MAKVAVVFALVAATLWAVPPRITPRGKVIPPKPAVDILAEAKGKILRWQFAPGEILELKKFSDQVIKIGKETQQRSVFHRVLLEARSADPARGYLLEGTFTTLIRGGDAKGAYNETERFAAGFYLNPRGQFEVTREQYMPNIRSVPTFTENRDPALKDDALLDIGATWERPGEEVMKFSSLITVPFSVRYEYRGQEKVKSEEGEKNCHKFISNYELNYGDANPENPKATDGSGGAEMPERALKAGPRVFGYVTAVWFWDAEQGIPYYATEEYNVIIVNEEGLANEFKIKSRSYYRKFHARTEDAKVQLAQKLKETIEKENPQLGVRVTDHGVAISLPDVFFATDSSKLSGEAKETLDRVGQILKVTDSRHIRVRGHTDSTGDADYNQKLSEARAERVADYLIDSAELNADTMSYEGKGARDPIADNGTSEGRARNRRVEIILLDK
jgi:outer membrane protein OmpA-like peptidoglycan-associated protein